MLEAIDEVREPRRRLHLLGVTRTEQVASFQRYGVTSFDSTSPFRQAFKDDRDNFHGADRTWIALRVPRSTPTQSCSVGSAPARSTAAPRAARAAGARESLRALRPRRRRRSTRRVDALREYEVLHDDRYDRSGRTPRRSVTRPGALRLRGLRARSGSRSRSSAAPSATSAAASTTCTCSRERLERQLAAARAPQPDRSRMTALTAAAPADGYELRLPRSRSGRTGERTLYSFAVDGKKLPLFAAVSRVKRDAEHQLAGYQRAESIQHIRTIRRYLETADAVLPNALVVAFDSRVRFEADRRPDRRTATADRAPDRAGRRGRDRRARSQAGSSTASSAPPRSARPTSTASRSTSPRSSPTA